MRPGRDSPPRAPSTPLCPHPPRAVCPARDRPACALKPRPPPSVPTGPTSLPDGRKQPRQPAAAGPSISQLRPPGEAWPLLRTAASAVCPVSRGVHAGPRLRAPPGRCPGRGRGGYCVPTVRRAHSSPSALGQHSGAASADGQDTALPCPLSVHTDARRCPLGVGRRGPSGWRLKPPWPPAGVADQKRLSLLPQPGPLGE